MKMLKLIQLFSLTLNLCMIECKRKTLRDTVSSSDCYPCPIPKKKKPALVCKKVCVTKKRPRRCEPPNRPRRPHLPMCPPSSPPCPPDTTCRQVLTTLNQLLSDKLLDLEYLFASKTQLLQDGIRDAVLGHGRRFAKDAKDSNTALVNTLLGLLSTSSTAVSSEVTQIVTRANTSLLNGFNSLVNTANANTSTLVTALAGQTAAQIDTVVKDLRGTNGLLSQLLRITGSLSTGMTDLFETVGPTELAAITQAIGTLSPLAEQVRDAVNTSNQALLKIHSRYIVHLTKKLAEFVHWYANDLLLAVETLFADYVFEVNRIVSSVLSCNENDLTPRYQRPGQLLRGGQQPLALNNPRYGGRLAQLLPDGLPGDDSLLFGGSPSALPTSTG